MGKKGEREEGGEGGERRTGPLAQSMVTTPSHAVSVLIECVPTSASLAFIVARRRRSAVTDDGDGTTSW